MTAELAGFTTTTRTGFELLLSQEAVVNFQLSLSSLQETVTVTGEARLLDVTQSRASGNIDPRQMQDLPVNGRNWMALSMLAPGNRSNAVGEAPIDRAMGNYQLSVDGQQVTQMVSLISQGSPRHSRDAIAEFELIANRFDATQGRSAGVQVNAITKSGTNTPAGTASGYFRHDRFNAADFVQGRVLPYSNPQLSGTFGGPIVKDKIHYFANYEYEREPKTTTFSSPFARFNIDVPSTSTEHKSGVRVDVQFSPKTRLSVRGSTFHFDEPYSSPAGGTAHPSSAVSIERSEYQLFATFTRVVSDRAVNELKGGYGRFPGSRRSTLCQSREGAPGEAALQRLRDLG